MGFKIETWNVAFREKKQRNILEDLKAPFKIIGNGRFGWAADPFLFDYQNETYLFLEFLKYKYDKGEIAYAKYDKKKKKFGKYKTIISEDYHMSYPFVFKHNNDIYMMPEISGSNTLGLYKAIDFPEKWERLNPLIEGEKLVDTTLVGINGKYYALTYKIDEATENDGKLLLLNFENGRVEFSKQGVLSTDVSIARPGGMFFYDGDKLIRVSQDCTGEYGRAINFLEVTGDFENIYSEKLIKKIEPYEIKSNIKRRHCGVHTYNTNAELEVVDLKYYRYSFIRVFYKLLRMIVK